MMKIRGLSVTVCGGGAAFILSSLGSSMIDTDPALWYILITLSFLAFCVGFVMWVREKDQRKER